MTKRLGSPYILLPIDMQPHFLSYLPVEVRQGLRKDMRDFITETEPLGVGVQWVVYDKHARILLPPHVAHLIQGYGLEAVGAKRHHGIILKKETNVFCVPELADHLGRNNLPVFCGGYVLGCVFDSIKGALLSGFSTCIMLPDLIVDSDGRDDPEIYQMDVEKELTREGLGGKVQYFTREKFIQHVRSQVIKPQQQPVEAAYAL